MSAAKNNQLMPESEFDDENNNSDNIPYHARQNARPFTYGNLPQGFSKSSLKHVVTDPEQIEQHIMESKVSATVFNSPKSQRKNIRPCVSGSRPVLHKTPSRSEFEEMLKERSEQFMRDENYNAIKLAQNASIQKDLDELQEILSKKCRNEEQPFADAINSNEVADILHVESIDLPDYADDNNKSTAFSLPDEKRESLLIVKREAGSFDEKDDYEMELDREETSRRPETPGFPALPYSTLNEDRCISPYPQCQDGVSNGKNMLTSEMIDEYGKKSQAIPEQQEVESCFISFARDHSEYWYKPHMTRDEAMILLRDAIPGTFIIRMSTTYKNAYGLVLKVERPPPGVVMSNNSNGLELVRHFLIEPTARGVRLKGCANEPIFTSLSAFVYQHSINPIALPCKLIIPEKELTHSSDGDYLQSKKKLLEQGAACNVLLLATYEMESLTGDEAMRKAVRQLLVERSGIVPVEVHLKVSSQGITLTDNTRTLFFRKHFAAQNISYVSIDPDNHFWMLPSSDLDIGITSNRGIFGFVARPLGLSRDNQCILFCDLTPNQPADSIVSFANKVLQIHQQHTNQML